MSRMTHSIRHAERLLVAAGVLALAVAVPDERLAAQAAPVPVIPDTIWLRPGTSRVATLAEPGGCLSLRVAPGDTAGLTMPRASGDSRADPRMPRGSGFRPPCEPVRPATPTVARMFRMPDGTLRAMPAPKPNVPPRP